MIIYEFSRVQFTMEVTLGNIGVAVSICATMVGGLWRLKAYLDEKFSWVDELYFEHCKEVGKRIPRKLADKFVKPNGNGKKEI